MQRAPAQARPILNSIRGLSLLTWEMGAGVRLLGVKSEYLCWLRVRGRNPKGLS